LAFLRVTARPVGSEPTGILFASIPRLLENAPLEQLREHF
jgi:hypothetical protein